MMAIPRGSQLPLLVDLRTINYCCLIEQITQLKENAPDEESFVPIAKAPSSEMTNYNDLQAFGRQCSPMS